MTSAFLRYSVLRFALFAACLVVAAIVQHGLTIEGTLVAIVASAALSWFFLRAPREELARDIAERVDERTERRQANPRASRWDVDTAAEDAEADRAEAQAAEHR